MTCVWCRCGGGNIGIVKWKAETDVWFSGCRGGDGDVGTEWTVAKEAIACG